MAASIELFTLQELKDKGDAFMWPSDGEMNVMSPSLWLMVKTNPDHPPWMPVAATLSLDGQRVATISFANQTIEFEGEQIPCLWGHGLRSASGVRSAGLGGMFLKEVLRKLRQMGVPFATYGSSPFAVSIYRALRMVDAGLAPRFVMPVGGRSVANRYVPNRALASCAGHLLTAGLRIRTGLSKLACSRAGPRLNFIEFDGNERCDISMPKERGWIRRTPEMIAWKLRFARSDKTAQTKAYGCYDDTGRQVAFMMLRVAVHEEVGHQGFRDARLCRVMDLVTDGSQEAAAGALYHLLQHCTREYFDFIELITCDPSIQRACEKSMFLRTSGFDLLITRNNVPEALLDIDSWRFNMIESDPAFA